QRSHLRNDLVGLSVADGKILVAFRIVFGESLSGAGQYFQADVTFGHRVRVSEVKHPGIAARMHRLRENKSTELAVVDRLANDNPRLVRLATRVARNEILLRD